MSSPTPLLDFFRRGEVSRDMRLVVAQGVVAPRAHEQIAILMLLVNDDDDEIRAAAGNTLNGIPTDALQSFLARQDVAPAVRDFFQARGISPGAVPSAASEDPLIDRGSEVEEGPDARDGPQSQQTLLQRLQRMGFTDRVKAAMRGSREMRAILIRDPNKIIATAVLSSPKVSEAEVESFAKMTTVSEDVLRTIAMNRSWLKNYSVVLSLTKNPKTPVALSLNLLNRLTERDVTGVSTDRNVPEPLRIAARRKVALGNR